jgi:amidohydrolase
VRNILIPNSKIQQLLIIRILFYLCIMLSDLIKLRKHLHKFPELSGHEKHTSEYLIEFLQKNTNAKIFDNIGGYGFLAEFHFSNNGPHVLFRCDLDALPIKEKNTFDHASIFNNISHMCGHDGHMAIMSGFALKLNEADNLKGKVFLLYQPAEEIAAGAKDVMEDKTFKELIPDYVFALHNLPGFKKHSIIIQEGLFTPSVLSISFDFTGKTSHAAQPEKGMNPSIAIAECIRRIEKLSVPDRKKENFNIITPVHVNIGAKDYGISPGYGELHYTIRTKSSIEIEYLKNKMIDIVSEECRAYNLELNYDTFEYFPSVQNDKEASEIVKNAAQNLDLETIEESIAFGEDFGWFTKEYRGALFGVGAGMDTPALHNDDYDFPDDIIESGILMFWEIIKTIQN